MQQNNSIPLCTLLLYSTIDDFFENQANKTESIQMNSFVY